MINKLNSKKITYCQTSPEACASDLAYRHLLITDSLLLWTVYFALENESPFIFSKFNPLNRDTPLIRTLSFHPVSILMGFDCKSKKLMKRKRYISKLK